MKVTMVFYPSVAAQKSNTPKDLLQVTTELTEDEASRFVAQGRSVEAMKRIYSARVERK